MIRKTIIILFLISLLQGAALADQDCTSKLKADFSTPEQAFNTLLLSIRCRDIELYRQCWESEEILKKEGELDFFLKDPESFWNELNSIFKGEISFEVTSQKDDRARCSSTSSDPASDGGIGSISFTKVKGQWKVHSW